MKKQYPSYKELHKLFKYNEETGILIHKEKTVNDLKVFKRWNSRYANKQAGGISKTNGYAQVSINNHPYYQHRIIFIMEYGYNPENEIDHIDRDRTNNKLDNLREVTRSCNTKNRDIQTNNNSGVTGVYQDKRTLSWVAQIKVSGVITTKTFKNFDDAVICRYNMEQARKFYKCNSESSAYKYLYVKRKTAKKKINI